MELLRVPGDDLRALLQRRPEGVARLGRNAVYGLDLAMQTASDLLIREASARCAAALLRLAVFRVRPRLLSYRKASAPAADAE